MINLNQLFLDDPKAFQKVILTSFSIAVLEKVINFKITTAKQLAEFCELPVCTAGIQMKLLAEKGYLDRTLNKEVYNRGEYIYSLKQSISKGIEQSG